MTQIYFSQDHEWVSVDADGIATIGITDHAQQALGDIVFVELPEPGREVAANEAVAVVESVKAASDVYAPLTGTMVENNAALIGEPALLNQEPEGAAWLFKLRLSDAGELKGLLDRAGYDSFLETLA
jgi:glycine cleavage system H protein